MLVIGETLIEAVVSPVFHKKDPPAIDGDAVSVIKSPAQIVPELIDKVGITAFATTSTVSIMGSVQPPASSTDTS